MLTDEEIVDHVQHMGCEEMDVELIEYEDHTSVCPLLYSIAR